MKKITIQPIGTIHSPYKNIEEIPIQGNLKEDVEAWVELEKKYVNGLKDLDKFSHAILLFYFHKSKKEKILSKPYLESKIHGIFAIRSPSRPNHIGMSIVKIRYIKNNRLYFTYVDMINGTPLIDIKPYVKYFDIKDDVDSGWIKKHFENK